MTEPVDQAIAALRDIATSYPVTDEGEAMAAIAREAIREWDAARRRAAFDPDPPASWGGDPIPLAQARTFNVFAAMEAQQRETTPALAAALDRHAAAVAAQANQTAAMVRQMVRVHEMGADGKSAQYIYLGEREYRALRTYCDPEVSGALVEFGGIPVLEVRTESHIGVS